MRYDEVVWTDSARGRWIRLGPDEFLEGPSSTYSTCTDGSETPGPTEHEHEHEECTWSCQRQGTTATLGSASEICAQSDDAVDALEGAVVRCEIAVPRPLVPHVQEGNVRTGPGSNQ